MQVNAQQILRCAQDDNSGVQDDTRPAYFAAFGITSHGIPIHSFAIHSFAIHSLAAHSLASIASNNCPAILSPNCASSSRMQVGLVTLTSVR